MGLPSSSASLADLLTFKQNIPATDWSSFLFGVFPAFMVLNKMLKIKKDKLKILNSSGISGNGIQDPLKKKRKEKEKKIQ